MLSKCRTCARGSTDDGRTGAMKDSHHDELRRRDDGEAGLRDDLARVARLCRVGLLVALDVEGLVARVAFERALAPERFEAGRQLARDAHPEARRVRLERGPRRVECDPAVDGQELSADVDVAPDGVAAERARAPHAYAAPGEGTQAVDALRIQLVLLLVVNVRFEVYGPEHLLVRRGLEDADARVRARVDSGDVPARRDVAQALGRGDARLQVRVEDLHPGVVERGVEGLGLPRRERLALRHDGLGRPLRERVEHGQAVVVLGAVRHGVALHAYDGFDARLRLVRTGAEHHRVGDGQQVEVADGRERFDRVLQCRLPVRRRRVRRHDVTARAAVAEEPFDRLGQVAVRRRAELRGELLLAEELEGLAEARLALRVPADHRDEADEGGDARLERRFRSEENLLAVDARSFGVRRHKLLERRSPRASLARRAELADAEDYELSRADDCDADFGNDLSEFPQLRRVRFRVALDVEGLGGRVAEERARTPDVREEGRHVARDLLPERGRVRLEDDPLRALVNGLAQVDERSADVDVLQVLVGVAARGACPPDAYVAVQRADAVDALRVQTVLLALAQVVAKAESAEHGLVGRGLVHAALGVNARVDSGDVAAGRDEAEAFAVGVGGLRRGVEDLYPGEVDGCVVRVRRGDRVGVVRVKQCEVERAARLHVPGAVEDCEAVFRLLRAVRDDGVARVLVGEAGGDDDGDLVNGLEGREHRGDIGRVLRARRGGRGGRGVRARLTLGSLPGCRVGRARRARRVGRARCAAPPGRVGRARRSRRSRRGRRFGGGREARDVAARAAVVEEAIDGVREVRLLLVGRKVAEEFFVLGEVRAQLHHARRDRLEEGRVADCDDIALRGRGGGLDLREAALVRHSSRGACR